MNMEKIKICADDLGWEIVEDRPEDYFLRLRNRRFTTDVYYSKRGTVRLKQNEGGENCYLKWMTTKDVLTLLEKPEDYYKGVSHQIN